MDNELDQLKRVNLADYAVSQGYEFNKKKSSRHSLCYDHPNGDRILVGRDPASGHSVYCSVRDDSDNGTLIDFVQKRQGLNLGQVRKELRPYAGIGSAPRPSYKPQPVPEPVEKDRVEQQRGLAACEPVTGQHRYLRSRALAAGTLEHFKDKVYADARGNAVFPHYDTQGVCGLEIKNQNFTGFSKAGEKGLWFHGPKEPSRVVVCESAIDCMSHYQLSRKRNDPEADRTLYVSTAGKQSPEAEQNLKSLVGHYPQATIVAGFDNDKDGQKLSERLVELAERDVTRQVPSNKDWNDDLQAQHKQELELAREQERDDDRYGLGR